MSSWRRGLVSRDRPVKPGAVVRTLIAQSTAPGDLVLDPFCGSGVAGVEARALDRRFLLGDIDLAYLDPSLAALARTTPSFARAAVVMEEPAEPPELEALADASAAEDELDAARGLRLAGRRRRDGSAG